MRGVWAQWYTDAVFTRPEPPRRGDEHRDFFASKGDVRQVWARTTEHPPGLLYLPDGGVTDEVRARAKSGALLCPLPDCPAPEFIARGRELRRHHFAHHPGTSAAHKPIDVWLHAASAALSRWAAQRYPDAVDATVIEPGTVELRSAETGTARTVTVIYERRSLPVVEPEDAHILIGHDVSLLNNPAPLDSHPGTYTCGRNAAVDRAIARRGYALVLNPQENRVATIALVSRLGHLLPAGANTGAAPYLIVVDDLDDCQLSADGIITPTSQQLAQLAPPPPAHVRPPRPPEPEPAPRSAPAITPPPKGRDDRRAAYRRSAPPPRRRAGRRDRQTASRREPRGWRR